MVKEINIYKAEPKAYKKITDFAKVNLSKKKADELMELIYQWSELAIELEQRCNQ